MLFVCVCACLLVCLLLGRVVLVLVLVLGLVLVLVLDGPLSPYTLSPSQRSKTFCWQLSLESSELSRCACSQESERQHVVILVRNTGLPRLDSNEHHMWSSWYGIRACPGSIALSITCDNPGTK